MEAIILAGGFGTRLQSIVKDVPKPMADVGGRPFLSYVLDYAFSRGVRKVLLSVGYKREIIQACFGAKYGGLDIEYVVEDEPLGTGGAIRAALQRALGEHVAVLNGDTFFAIDYKSMNDFHCQRNADITIALKPMRNFDRYGSVIVGGEGNITGFREKTLRPSGYINGGVYILKKNAMGRLKQYGKRFSFESEFLQKNIDRLAAYAFVSDDFFIDIGTPVDYKKAQETLARAVKEGKW